MLISGDDTGGYNTVRIALDQLHGSLHVASEAQTEEIWLARNNLRRLDQLTTMIVRLGAILFVCLYGVVL